MLKKQKILILSITSALMMCVLFYITKTKAEEPRQQLLRENSDISTRSDDSDFSTYSDDSTSSTESTEELQSELHKEKFKKIAQTLLKRFYLKKLQHAEIELSNIQSIYGMFASPKTAAQFYSKDPKELSKGKEYKLAVLFCDIESFTPLSEQNHHLDMYNLLNNYLGGIANIVTKRNGLVDKFIGDAVMAIFIADNETKACERAVRCAREIIRYSTKFPADKYVDGRKRLKNGIGIHVGPAAVGLIQGHLMVTGDAINIAARLEGKTRSLKTPILISEDVYDAIPQKMKEHYHFEPFKNIELKGKSERFTLYGVQSKRKVKSVALPQLKQSW